MAFDKDGREYGPVTLTMDGSETVHLAPEDVVRGNRASGVSGATDSGRENESTGVVGQTGHHGVVPPFFPEGTMKQILIICVAAVLASCASKTQPQLPQPENGLCGLKQDTCRRGTPSNTGDTTPPYEWTCLGSYGGRNDSCSIPTAGIGAGEVFAGRNALEERVKAAGPLRGTLTIRDHTVDSDDPSHADNMRKVALRMGVPEENFTIIGGLRLRDFFTKDKWKSLRERTLVMAFPTTWAADLSPDEPAIVAEQDILFVGGAINTDTKGYNRRDFWYPDHPQWEGNDKWERAFANFATGKVIIATYADLFAGEVVPYTRTVKCGLAKEFCYSVIRPPDLTPNDKYGQGSSGASVYLASLTFYLSQLWHTPQEVIGVLNVCAEDVGEPGIDEEFGRGVVSVVCDTVQNREAGVVASSMRMYNASPVLTQMTGNYVVTQPVPQSPSALPQLSSTRFRPFYAIRGHNLRTVTGHLGGQFSVKATDLFVSGGADYAPLGVRSSLLHTVRTPFMEFGARRTLFSRGRHLISLLGTYGYSDGNGFSAHVGHAGARYEQRFVSATLSLQAGYQLAQSLVGIPGYREAGADLVPFTDGNPEIRFSVSLGR